MKDLRSISIEEFEKDFSTCLAQVEEDGPLLLTREGKKYSVLVSLDDFAELMVATTGAFSHRTGYLYLLPRQECGLEALSEVVFRACLKADLKNPMVGVGNPPFLAVEVEVEGGSAAVEAGSEIIFTSLPAGTVYVDGKDLDPFVLKEFKALGFDDVDEAFDFLFSDLKGVEKL